MSEIAIKRTTELAQIDPQKAKYEMIASEAGMKAAAMDNDAEGVHIAISKHVGACADLVAWWDQVAVKEGPGAYQQGNDTGSGIVAYDESPLSPNQMSRLRKKVATDGHIDQGKLEGFVEELFSKYGKGFAGQKATEIGGVALSTGFHEWYTPPEYADACRDVMGGIDLDPASCEKANTLVRADRYYTKDDDGLAQPWSGRVYINPPYSAELVRGFSEKLASEYSAGNIEAGMFLVHNSTETSWWQNLMAVCDIVSFPSKRVNFIDGRSMRKEPGESIRGQSILYLGPDPAKFNEVFSRFGLVMVRYGV